MCHPRSFVFVFKTISGSSMRPMYISGVKSGFCQTDAPIGDFEKGFSDASHVEHSSICKVVKTSMSVYSSECDTYPVGDTIKDVGLRLIFEAHSQWTSLMMECKPGPFNPCYIFSQDENGRISRQIMTLMRKAISLLAEVTIFLNSQQWHFDAEIQI